VAALRSLQLDFVRAVLDGDASALARQVKARGGTAQSRLAIYRNNTYSNLRGALADVYPVIRRLVGDAFFNHAADQFIAGHPSASGDLNDYGDGFAEFLAAYPHAADLLYLPDVAHLEWAHERAFYAPDAAPLDPGRLAQVVPERQGDLRFRLNPAAHLLDSPWPLLRIWQTNQPEHTSDDHVDLDAGGGALLVTRRAGETLIEPLAPSEAAFLRALQQGRPLIDAAQAALDVANGFDLPACLMRRVTQTDIVDFYLP